MDRYQRLTEKYEKLEDEKKALEVLYSIALVTINQFSGITKEQFEQVVVNTMENECLKR
jgi:hypothetical protein